MKRNKFHLRKGGPGRRIHKAPKGLLGMLQKWMPVSDKYAYLYNLPWSKQGQLFMDLLLAELSNNPSTRPKHIYFTSKYAARAYTRWREKKMRDAHIDVKHVGKPFTAVRPTEIISDDCEGTRDA